MPLDGFWEEFAGDLASSLQHYRRQVERLQVREKDDKTLLTDADLAMEELIVDRIRRVDPGAVIVAEEDDQTTSRAGVLTAPEWIWVVDPIDGTAEFVRPDRVEFCSVVCLLRHREPVATLVVAPELGPAGTPLTIVADRRSGVVTVNGAPVPSNAAPAPRRASVTRSQGTPPRRFEAILHGAGYTLKTRTTSQTLDLVRTAIDLRPFAGEAFAPFRFFYRENQKVWDGLAGLCLGVTVGQSTVDGLGNDRLPVPLELLSQPEPTFDVTVMGPSEEVEWFLHTTRQPAQ